MPVEQRMVQTETIAEVHAREHNDSTDPEHELAVAKKIVLRVNGSKVGQTGEGLGTTTNEEQNEVVTRRKEWGR